MAHLRLSEYQTLPDVELTPDEISALRALRPKLGLAPSLLPGHYDLTADSWVGVINFGVRTIEIRPKIEIDRLLFLLSYCLDPRHWNDTPFNFGERESLLAAIIPGFVFHVRKAIGRGVLQGYRLEEEALNTVRGRIRFADQLRDRFGIAPPIEVRYHEYTEDTIENRLIKAALTRLKMLRIRSNQTRLLLHEFDTPLSRVRLVEFHPGALPDMVYTRLNAHYRPAIELAKLVLRATSFELATGAVQATTFLIDMNQVFEDFVVISLREALGVSAHAFPQGATGHRLYLDEQRTLPLKPDISWWEHDRCVFAGDAKYKKLAGSSGANTDIYQVLAYTIAANLSHGLLIYAQGEAKPAWHRIMHADKVIEVVALGLVMPSDAILAQIGNIAEQVRVHRQRVAVPGSALASDTLGNNY